MKGLAVILIGIAAGLPLASAQAAGGGAGAGGAGHQRAINSGLPPGERGPLGAPNNPRPAAPTPTSVERSGHAETNPGR